MSPSVSDVVPSVRLRSAHTPAAASMAPQRLQMAMLTVDAGATSVAGT